MTQSLGRALPLRSFSKFRRLAITHAAMMGGDAAMVVALANTLFFSIDPSEARWRVLLFLSVSFAPFLLLAPLIGPVLDRIAGGRRTAIQLVALSRIVLSVLMAFAINTLALFPLVFVALVLQKTYVVSKSAIVPSVVRTDSELVEANSKLGLIAGIIGFAAVVPAGLLQLTPAKGSGTMIYSALLFGFALYASMALSADVVASTAADAQEEQQLRSPRLSMGALVMMLLRASIGFMFFLTAFWLQTKDSGTAWLGLCVAGAAVGSLLGNAVGPRLRGLLPERTMLLGSLAVAAASGFAAAAIGTIPAIAALALMLSFAGSIARLGFEAMVQTDAPHANRGRALSNFETRFQLCWAAAGAIAVAITVSSPLGAVIVGATCAGGLAYIWARPRLESRPATTEQAPRRWKIRRPPGRRGRPVPAEGVAGISDGSVGDGSG